MAAAIYDIATRKRIDIENTIRIRALELYEERIKNGTEGTDEGDWAKAQLEYRSTHWY